MSLQDNASQSIRVEARFSHLPTLLSFLTAALAGVAGDAPLRARLAVEELFANSIHHGYGGESDQPVWLNVRRDADLLQLNYADAAPPFDPFAGNRDTATTGNLEQRPVGGLGRLLLMQMASRCHYRYADGRNVIKLDYSLTSGA